MSNYLKGLDDNKETYFFQEDKVVLGGNVVSDRYVVICHAIIPENLLTLRHLAFFL